MDLSIDSSVELKQLRALWYGVGFGQRWRVPRHLVPGIARKIGEPTKTWRQLAQLCFDQRGAFPTTSVLDNFDRANADPISGSWARFYTPGSDLRIVSNQCVGPTSSIAAGYYTAATYGPDSEAFATFAIRTDSSGRLWLMARGGSPGSALNCYNLRVQPTAGAGNDVWQIEKDGSGTPIGATFTQEVAVGDSFGMDVIGTTIGAYFKASAGSWTQLTTRTDSTYVGTGSIGAWLDINQGIDNFGGGTVVTAGATLFRRTLNTRAGSRG